MPLCVLMWMPLTLNRSLKQVSEHWIFTLIDTKLIGCSELRPSKKFKQSKVPAKPAQRVEEEEVEFDPVEGDEDFDMSDDEREYDASASRYLANEVPYILSSKHPAEIF